MPVALWTSRAFVEEARDWVGEQVAARGVSLTGVVEQPHARPWSSALRFESSEGPLWFKVNGPGTRHEPGLVGLLAELVPTLVPTVIGIDGERGWSLTGDAGPVLRSTGEPAELFGAWESILPTYAEAQLALAAHEDALVDTGLPLLRPFDLPAALDDLVATLAARSADAGGLDADEVAAFEALRPEYASWCAELAESPVPDSLNHDDLHSSNVCVGGAGHRIIDWGDASWGSPLGTMLATLNSIAWHAGVERTDPRVARVLDAYLEPFTALADADDLRRWVFLARRAGCVTRARCYVRAFEGEPPSAEADDDWPVRGWLQETLDPSVG